MALTDKRIEAPAEDIIDLNIDAIKKQKFRINGDPKAVIELNLSDLNVSDRLEKGVKKLEESMTKIASLPDDEELSNKLDEINKVMCETVDYIFDSSISEVCCKGGTMYDPYNGMFRWEHILDSLTSLYTNNLNTEFKKLKARVQKHTQKYVGKKSSRGK